MDYFKVTVFSYEEKKYWVEGVYTFKDLEKAKKLAKGSIKEGYDVVVWSGDYLIGYGGPHMNEKDAMKNGTGTVNRLTKKYDSIEKLSASKISSELIKIAKLLSAELIDFSKSEKEQEEALNNFVEILETKLPNSIKFKLDRLAKSYKFEILYKNRRIANLFLIYDRYFALGACFYTFYIDRPDNKNQIKLEGKSNVKNPTINQAVEYIKSLVNLVDKNKKASKKYEVKIYTETIPGTAFDEDKEITEEDVETEKENVEKFDNLFEVVEFLKDKTGFSLEGYSSMGDGRYRTIDEDVDYATGDRVMYTYIIEDLDRKEMKLVDECVKKRKNLIPDPMDFDTDEEWKLELDKLLK